MTVLKVPLEIIENKRWRLDVLNKAEKDIEMQLLIKRQCRLDFEFFIDGFCWTYDPRESDPHKPFILWPKQRAFLRWLEELYRRSQRGEKVNIVIDKPRAVGVSYCIMVWFFWHYLFHDFSGRVGSRKESFVDTKGDPDALFSKIDYQIERMPAWFTESVERNYMLLKLNDQMRQNSIVGESANPNFGRGGRKNAMLFDEFGFWEWAKSSWESSGESSNFRIATSTPPESGRDSHYWKLLNNLAGRVNIFEFDWNDDPRRNADWLTEAKATKSQEEFAREVMKSFEGTTVGKVYADSFRQVVLSSVDYEPALPLFVSWDFGLDSVAMIWWQKNFETNRVTMIDCYTNENKEIGFYVPFVTGVVKSGQHEYNTYELEIIERHKLWSKTVTHFGDPDVRKRNLINKESVKDYLYNTEHIYVQSIPWGGREWNDMKQKSLLLFRRLEVNDKRCEPVMSAMRNAKYPEMREGSQRTNEPIKPIHDWTSHFRTSLEYFADNEPMGNMVRTIVNPTGPAQVRTMLPHEVEAERERAVKLNMQVRTVLRAVNNSNKNRPL